MAPELRKRKAPVVAEPKKNGVTAAKVAEKATAKGKRKAAEDASPVTIKKQKPTKKAATESTPVKKPTKNAKSKKAPKEVEAEQEEAADAGATLEVSESESEAEEEGEGQVQTLAAKLDPEDDNGAKGEALFKPGQDVGKIPEVAKKGDKKSGASDEEPGVIYMGRLPHGFYEYEIRQYLSQFGPVTKLRLSRNKKTGASKHFAFVEFAEASTAEIVVKTMDNYLLFGHILKCKLVPKEQVHEDLFKGANRRFKKVPWNKMAGRKLEKPMTEAAWDKKSEKEKSKRDKKAAKLKALGYEFEAPELKKAPAAPVVDEEKEEPKAIEAAPEETSKDAEKEAEPAAESTEAPKEAETIPAAKPKATKAKTGRATRAKRAKA
ncbi:hypothetical protein B0I35DRAFT_396455 [Stachybotrys elegans]|uniref:RRM domain-containing protein n=1 Tax=Stachybotrys elegans TaxID=80388 RepID=A0A8K0WPX1_9HYPO|nr:hypothetical protein B0I35DRAFT_396455 [Stachybotrys elegans]